jgi:hypothetical protein
MTPGGKWTNKQAKHSSGGLILIPANLATDDPCPPQIYLKRHPDAIIRRVVYVCQGLA